MFSRHQLKMCLSLTAMFQNDGGRFLNTTNCKLLYTDVTTILHVVHYCAGRNCVNSLQRNQPADYKSTIRTVNQESDLLSCEISLRVYVLIWQMNCLSLSLRFRLVKPSFHMIVDDRYDRWDRCDR